MVFILDCCLKASFLVEFGCGNMEENQKGKYIGFDFVFENCFLFLKIRIKKIERTCVVLRFFYYSESI